MGSNVETPTVKEKHVEVFGKAACALHQSNQAFIFSMFLIFAVTAAAPMPPIWTCSLMYQRVLQKF